MRIDSHKEGCVAVSCSGGTPTYEKMAVGHNLGRLQKAAAVSQDTATRTGSGAKPALAACGRGPPSTPWASSAGPARPRAACRQRTGRSFSAAPAVLSAWRGAIRPVTTKTKVTSSWRKGASPLSSALVHLAFGLAAPARCFPTYSIRWGLYPLGTTKRQLVKCASNRNWERKVPTMQDRCTSPGNSPREARHPTPR